MKSFESVGIWFLPDQPDKRVPGTLSFSVDDGFALRLSGALTPHVFSLAKYSAIHGIVSESPYGKHISLFGCFADSLQLGISGIALETIHANYGFAGDEFIESAEELFDGAELHFRQLSTWFGYSGLKVAYKPEVQVSWKSPPEYTCHLADASLRTAFGLTIKGAPPLVSLEENASLSISGLDRCTAADIDSRYAHPLRMLLTFASDKIAWPERYSLLRRGPGRAYPVRFDRLHAPVRLDKSGGQKLPGNFLFLLRDVAARFETFIQSWLHFTETHPDFCSIFFNTCYEEHGFVESRFASVMQAFELLLQDEAALDEETICKFEKVRTAALNSVSAPSLAYTMSLPSAVELAMPTRVAKLMAEHWELIRGIVGTDAPHFIDRLFSTRNYVAHRGPLPIGVIAGADLYWLQQRVLAVIKVYVLGRLGFTQDAISEIVTRNPTMNHLKTVKAPWAPAGP